MLSEMNFFMIEVENRQTVKLLPMISPEMNMFKELTIIASNIVKGNHENIEKKEMKLLVNIANTNMKDFTIEQLQGVIKSI